MRYLLIDQPLHSVKRARFVNKHIKYAFRTHYTLMIKKAAATEEENI